MALIVLRLVPTESVSPGDFLAALNNLSIEAFELSFTNPEGTPLTPATFLPPTNIPVSPGPAPTPTQNPATRLVQHFKVFPLGLGLFSRDDYAVATAVIEIPAGPEYKTADLSFRITRGGGDIIHHQRYYNVPINSGALPAPGNFQALMPVSLHLPLPLQGVQLNPATDAFVNMPADGTPPNYEDLLGAVQTVLNADPTGPVVIADMTLEKCRHISYEIVWNRSLYPIPDPLRSLEEMYTGPHPIDSAEERDRRKFEGDLQGYYAVHNAEAEKLTQYIFGIATSAWCERETTNAHQVFWRFPVIPGGITTDGKLSETQLILKGVGAVALAPPFTVTANFFYALASDLPIQVDANQRFQIAIRETSLSLTDKLTKAIGRGIINTPAGLSLTQWQAIRRLLTLYVFNNSTLTVYELSGAAEQALIQKFIDFQTEDINVFWSGLVAADQSAHLNFLLAAFSRETGATTPLSDSVRATGVASAAVLKGWTENQWRALFDPTLGGSMNNMPPFISPGSDEERIKSFLRHVRKFFEATSGLAVSPPSAAGVIPGLLRPVDNPLDTFLVNALGFSFDTWDGTQASIQGTLDMVFPNDADTQNQFAGWMNCIKSMLNLTVGIAPAEMRFAVIEALWARGLTSTEIIHKFTASELAEALFGSVAYDHAFVIWANAGSVTPNFPADLSGFKPINPDGSLTNCIPPLYRSPLGPVAYLHDLLRVSEDSTCETPIIYDSDTNLASLLGSRRGPLGELLVSEANLDIPIPLIDIVNESLEFMVATDTDNGTVYDTANDVVGEHELTSNPNLTRHVRLHDPETLLEVLPEHSTPATPTDSQHAYEILKNDFSSYNLPYSQALDINCTYLKALGTCRYSTVRRFRKDITEFVLDPSLETAEFQKQLWRYPVRIETAISYFCMSQDEYNFFTGGGVIVPQEPRRGGASRRTAAGANVGKYPLYTFYSYSKESIDVQDGEINWMEDLVKVSEFLDRTGLTYCQFIELWKSEFVKFYRDHEGQESVFPDCEPCCLEELIITFDSSNYPGLALYKLNLFIRLWRKLRTKKKAAYSFEQLRDICDVLVLFTGPTVNPDFIRQLVAFQMFRDDFQLSLTDGTTALTGGVGADRMHLLAFWVPGSSKWDWAVQHLLDQIQQYSKATFHGCSRGPEFIKLLFNNLSALSVLSGFEPDDVAGNHHWHQHPTDTLRFSEILAKIYASKSTVGELIFLFTAQPHLDGDDPFPQQTDNEANDSPFGLPDDEDPDSLWSLRKKLISVELNEEQATQWSWPRIESSMRDDFGMDDVGYVFLLSLGQHFFPNILSENGIMVSTAQRRYSTPLASGSTAALMWNTPPGGPFSYDSASEELYALIPLTDEAVMAKLATLRQLIPAEQQAVQDLYFLPRTDLARFAFIFSNFSEAEEKLIQEPEERIRWLWFQKEFAICHSRCKVIQEHLLSHVIRIAKQKNIEGPEIAKLVLKTIWGDENVAITPWEDDSGQTPGVTWAPLPNGGAYSALLGLVGTGMLIEYLTGSAKRWQNVLGGTDLYGQEENEWCAPVPTVLPSMSLTVPADLSKFISLHNGFALANLNDERIGGAEPFSIHWKGLLLIEGSGPYSFVAGSPTGNGELPDFDKIKSSHTWRVKLNRGQKVWVLLSHNWPKEEAPADCSKPIALKKGMYELSIEVERNPFSFNDPEDVYKQFTGFQLKYNGPDSNESPESIHFNKLFQKNKNSTLQNGLAITGVASDYLKIRYTSTVRDIRRTYIRVYKALLFVNKLDLSAKIISDNGQSELGFILSNPENFAGQSYYKNGAVYKTHKASFDFNFLPVRDNYFTNNPATDQRAMPSVKRQQAMFDWWERLFDYTIMRQESTVAPEHPVWLLFHESQERHTDDVFQLLRHMGVSVNHGNIVQLYNPDYELNDVGHEGDLNDDRWTIRAWKAEQWLRELESDFYEDDIRDARPDIWASIDPNGVEVFATESGNKNLTKFYRDGCIENSAPLRYKNVKQINDALRMRGQKALLSYLTNMDRVTLPWGGYAMEAKELSELLLIDVEAGICQKASRMEEAVSVSQLYVQRARLGFEADFLVTSNFIKVWDRHFVTFRAWESCKRHEIYRENWIEWDELGEAQRTESYQFLEMKLRESTLTVPVPGGLAYWNGSKPPAHPGLTLLQNRQPVAMQVLNPDREGLGLMGTPDRHARPAWLAALKKPNFDTGPENPGGNEPGGGEPIGRFANNNNNNNNNNGTDELGGLPLWLQAAVKLGAKFIRVAAAGIPLGSTMATPKCNRKATSVCCNECGKMHPALMDEYYFWIEESKYYEEPEQNADWGTTLDNKLSDWDRPDKLPSLLNWASNQKVHLRWCRVHNGEFQQPNQTFEGVRVNSVDAADLILTGRIGDSIYFSVTGGLKPLPEPGFPNTPAPGFRYDIQPDEAIVIPEVVPSPVPATIGGLTAYPFFAYFDPGAPLLPPSVFSPAITVAGNLRTHCQFESALKWYEFFYNPLLNDNSWKECSDEESDEENEEENNDEENDGENFNNGNRDDEETRTQNDCCCASNPVDDTKAKQRIILMHYLETLLQWGDALMRKNTPESFQQARLIFDTAEKILGKTPTTVKAYIGLNPDQKVELFSADCAPLNPRLLCIYTTVNDRISLIHSCLNAKRLQNGRPNLDMPYLGNSMIRDCWKTTEQVCLDEFDWCLPQSPYRFLFLLQRAQEMAGEVRALGVALLSAYEKGDGEYLSSIRAMHERQLLNLALNIRQQQWREADWQVQALEKSKETALIRRQYYADLIINGLKSGEIQYEALINVSQGFRLSANIAEASAGIMGIIPDIYAGFPVTQTHLPIGSKLAEATLMTVGRIMNALAERSSTNANLESMEAGWERREDEWKFQVETLDIDIQQIERQRLAAERRRSVALSELNNHQQQIENLAELHDFLRDKFTNHALYLWLQQETAALYYQMYDVALHCTRQAERAFNLERGHTSRKFIPYEIWDNLHEGLLSGERLQLVIRQMEKSYYDENTREYELTKHISLRLHSPFQLLQLRESGYCELEFPEWLFDLDYPGHYMRRIKNVTLSIPCIAGPYTGIHCRLTLLSSKTRVSPKILSPIHACCEDEGCKNGYETIPDDPRFIQAYTATEAIATSAGQNDSGMFELNFRDERYLPFEFKGAASRWRLEIPHENNFFDMNTLSDVVFHLNFMSREGGDLLRKEANECAQQHVPGDGVRLIDVKQETPDAWHLFQYNSKKPKELPLKFNTEMFPYLPGITNLWFKGFDIFFEPEECFSPDGITVQFIVNPSFADLVPDECDGDIIEIHCVHSREWPGLYHGALPLEGWPITSGDLKEYGRLKFPFIINKINNLHLLTGYCSTVESKKNECC